MNKRDIVNLIKRAFDKTPMPSPENVMLMGEGALGDMPTGDAWYVMRSFAGKRWQDLTADELRTGHAALSMMTPEGLRYYLPAYLTMILNDPEAADVEIDKTRWTISPPPFGFGHLEAFETRISLLSLPERIAVAYFFEYLRRSDEFGFFGDEPINRITNYWLKYYPTPMPVEASDFLGDVKPLRARPKDLGKRLLLTTIKEAFVDAPLPSEGQLTKPGRMSIPGTFKDQSTVTRFLRGRSWRSLTAADINYLSGSLPLMTPEGVHYYLPGFLTAIIKEQTQVLGNALKSTVWALSPPPFGTSSQEDFDERISLLTEPQRSSISNFFEYLRFTEFFLSQFLGSEPYEYLTYFWDSPECYRGVTDAMTLDTKKIP